MNIDSTIIVSAIEYIGNLFNKALEKKKPSDQGVMISMDDISRIQGQIFNVQKESYALLTENQNLNERIKDLENQLKEKDEIERHPENYITFKSDPQKIKYCSSCYGKDGSKIQLNDESDKYGTSNCPVCKNVIVSNQDVADAFHQRIVGQNRRCLNEGYTL